MGHLRINICCKNLKWTWANLVLAEHSCRITVVFIKALLLLTLFTAVISNSACAILHDFLFSLVFFLNLMRYCGFLGSLGPGSSSWVFHYFKEGFKYSWQGAISVHIHQACCRLENSSEMAGGVQHVHSRPLPTHTDNDALSTISTGTNTTEAPDPGLKLNLPPLSHTQWRGSERERQTRLSSRIFLGCFNHTKSSTFNTRATILRSRVELKESLWSSDISHQGWGHHSSSLRPPSDAIWCLTHLTHLQ